MNRSVVVVAVVIALMVGVVAGVVGTRVLGREECVALVRTAGAPRDTITPRPGTRPFYGSSTITNRVAGHKIGNDCVPNG